MTQEEELETGERTTRMTMDEVSSTGRERRLACNAVGSLP